ncbi:Piwi domain-containing protein [Halarchaeum acidiphilum]|nr:Piwi domain-containing protein [Halarchaeum acidiphilum]
MTLDELYSESDNPYGVKAAHDPERYSTEGQGWLRGWSDLHYTDLIENAGASVAEMHEGVADEEWRQKLIQDDPRLLKIKYGSNVRNQAPHFLKLAPRIEQVQDEDYAFFQRFASRRSMMPGEKFEYTKEFIESLSWLPVLELAFEPGPTNDGYNSIDIRGTRDRLIFQNSAPANNPSAGLRQYGVYQSPGQYRVGVLVPEAWSEIQREFPGLITKGLAEIQAPGGVTKYEYELGDISKYTPIAHQLHDETEVVVAVVPDPGKSEQFGIEDPHHEVKRTLMRQGVPTQMTTKSTVDELIKLGADAGNDKMLNILSAVVGKAGGTPWHIHDMPGETDAFMGLDVSHDQSSDKHTGASASVVLSDGTTYAAESTVGQSGETFSAEHVQQFVRDLVFDFAMEQGTEINRLCIMRDGKISEDIDAIRDGLSELSAEIDIVGVRKSGQPRVAEYDGTHFYIAQKGVAFVSDGQGHAIIHGSGKPEIKDDNSVGTPQTYRITRHSGPTDIETLARQAYWLSEVHIGSPVRSPRLPIPIGYADKAASYVSDEIVSPGTVIKGPAYI